MKIFSSFDFYQIWTVLLIVHWIRKWYSFTVHYTKNYRLLRHNSSHFWKHCMVKTFLSPLIHKGHIVIFYFKWIQLLFFLIFSGCTLFHLWFLWWWLHPRTRTREAEGDESAARGGHQIHLTGKNKFGKKSMKEYLYPRKKTGSFNWSWRWLLSILLKTC